jgi:tetratricopeptide (TPR) repeat protein
LGCVALAEGSYEEADRWFQECPRPLEKPDRAKLRACHGYAFQGLGQTAQAQAFFYQALCMANEGKLYPPLLHALPGIALLFADQGEIDRAVELYALASTFDWVAKSKWFADIAGDKIAAMAEGLPSEVVEAAKARGRELDLWDTAKALLAELEEQGWSSADQQPDYTSELQTRKGAPD